ncbi:MAG: Lrp/AsnC family transcriptional regulator [Deltaproteobacteria bacterium]|nr:Lrp/AsnC family transcriptional regulator [Deltaproteobacteria bacterium]
MVNAIVLINAEPKKINDLAQDLVKIDAITEVFSVGGRYDLAAIIRVKSNEELSDTVTGKLLSMDGIISTETLIAFRVYSQHDLERLFSIGME